MQEKGKKFASSSQPNMVTSTSTVAGGEPRLFLFLLHVQTEPARSLAGETKTRVSLKKGGSSHFFMTIQGNLAFLPRTFTGLLNRCPALAKTLGRNSYQAALKETFTYFLLLYEGVIGAWRVSGGVSVWKRLMGSTSGGAEERKNRQTGVWVWNEKFPLQGLIAQSFF